MNNLKPSDNIILTIDGLGSDGEGVGRHEGYTVFVENALPGEVVSVKMEVCKKSYGKASLLTILTHSPSREKPTCPLFGTCGGCQLMHLNYSEQLNIKSNKVLNALERIGKIKNPPVKGCLPSPKQLHYRNKIQLPAQQGSKGVKLGLYARSSHNLVELDHCFIHSDLGEEVYRTIKPILSQSKLSAYDPLTEQGELKHVLIKSSLRLNEALVILVTRSLNPDTLKPIAQGIMAASSLIKGVVQNVSEKPDNVILGDNFRTLAGASFIREKLGGLLFNISPASFFQVNPEQAELLYNKALEFGEIKGNETVLDAYCGVGTLSLFFAQAVKKVVGVECVPSAIQNAKENAQMNGIKNVEFICAHAENHIKNLKHIDLTILNPPRKGCEKTFLHELLKLKPPKIIYISCDPATLARDLAILTEKTYKLTAVQPFDMFPQTAHVECVAKLELIL